LRNRSKRQMRVLESIGARSQIINEPYCDQPKQRVKEWDQEILDKITIKSFQHTGRVYVLQFAVYNRAEMQTRMG
jgi:hypothetical protein